MVVRVDDDRAKELLAQARQGTEGELERLRGGSAALPEDQADASSDADGLVERGTDDALTELLTQRLEAIARAEHRLEEGTYGLSTLSGDPIPDGRLEVEPWAELTVEEQAAL
jgi:DnaK suppressor protein